MTAESNYQYRPTPLIDTGSPITVGHLLTMARNINNAKGHAKVHKLRGQPLFPWVYSEDTNTNEWVNLVMVPAFVPEGYTSLRWTMCHKRTAGTDGTRWQLYSTDRLYVGPQNGIDTDRLGPNFASSSMVSQVDTWFPEHALLDLVRDEATGLTWLVLTSTNGDASTRSAMCSLDATPRIE
jgi:hypothetical protein|tara:strand:- start:678 stop:1220 length:543 start_codon:yes stop_codon:yes gene_type:complete